MTIQLVVLDLDGTVLDPHSAAPISPAVLQAVHEVQQRGVGLTVATGRTLEYVRVRAEAMNLTLPVITSQGAVLGDPRDGSILHETLLDARSARKVADYAAAGERVVATYLREPGGGLLIVQNREERDPEVYDHWFGDGRILNGDLLPWLERGCQIIKTIVVSAPEDPEITPVLRNYLGDPVQVVRTHPYLVEATAAGVDKGSGLQRLLEHLGVPAEAVLAVGDHDNDLPMFEVAGLTVAMGQAEENVRGVADWVAPSVTDDGVAAALRRFILC